MIRSLIVIAALAMSCAVIPACQAQTNPTDEYVVGSATRQIDPAKREWLERAVTHILGDGGVRSDAR